MIPHQELKNVAGNVFYGNLFNLSKFELLGLQLLC